SCPLATCPLEGYIIVRGPHACRKVTCPSEGYMLVERLCACRKNAWPTSNEERWTTSDVVVAETVLDSDWALRRSLSRAMAELGGWSGARRVLSLAWHELGVEPCSARPEIDRREIVLVLGNDEGRPCARRRGRAGHVPVAPRVACLLVGNVPTMGDRPMSSRGATRLAPGF
ncbi:hypothetical protein Dimus_030286, partial [Dionaea muscipula]